MWIQCVKSFLYLLGRIVSMPHIVLRPQYRSLAASVQCHYTRHDALLPTPLLLLITLAFRPGVVGGVQQPGHLRQHPRVHQ
jgi:hypothetical protein